jgi:hypothetical protein
MRTYTAGEIITKQYGMSRNFITPTVIERELINNHTAFELSKGRGMSNQEIFGLTVVNINEYGATKTLINHSGLSDDLNDLRSKIKELKEIL